MRELDALLQAEALTVDEAFDYLAVLDEYDALRVAIRRVGADAVTYLEERGKIDYYLARSFDARMRFGNRGIVDLILAFFGLAEAVKPGQRVAIRNWFVRDMQKSFLGHLGLALDRRLALGPFTDEHRDAMEEHFARLGELPGGNVLPVFVNQLRFERLGRTLAALETHMPRVSLQDDVREERLREIRDLLCTRRIPQTRFLVGDGAVEFEGDAHAGFRNVGSLVSEFTVAIHETTSTTWLDWDSATLPDGVSLARFDRGDGKLTVPGTGVAAEELCTPSVARALEDAIITRLWNALRDAPDDPTLLTAPPPVAETREALAEIAVLPTPASPEGDAVATSVEAPEHVPPTLPAGAGDLPVPRGLRANEVLRRFTRLFGAPERVVGSHHVFRGMNGHTYPIALHMGRDVGTGMLLKSLRMLGSTVEEFETAAR